tara:strand:- start:10035 stop:11135 length:1101 start_codon:yes stop_codon:yes gene_type:complete
MGLPFAFWKSSAVASTTFDFSVDTTKTDGGSSSNTQFRIPFYQYGNAPNCTVDWGDGNSDTITTYNQAEATHTYATSGIYDIKIDGVIGSWRFNGSTATDEKKLLSISNWGIFNFDKNRAFYNCTNLTTISATDIPVITTGSLQQTFQSCAKLTNFNVDGWDVSGVTNLRLMFTSCSLLTTVNCENWNVGLVTRMDEMFKNCKDLITLDLSNWNTANVVNMRDTFYRNYDLTSIGDVSSLDVSGNVDFKGTFEDCRVLADLDASNWNLGSATRVDRMFYNADFFNNSLANWDINQITNFNSFMQNASGLSTANYDATLISWAGQTPSINESPNFGGSQYTLGGTAEAARNTLVSTYGWTITDGGGI